MFLDHTIFCVHDNIIVHSRRMIKKLNFCINYTLCCLNKAGMGFFFFFRISVFSDMVIRVDPSFFFLRGWGGSWLLHDD